MIVKYVDLELVLHVIMIRLSFVKVHLLVGALPLVGKGPLFLGTVNLSHNLPICYPIGL